MTSRTSAAPARPKTFRPLLITLAAVIVAALAAVGIWWGFTSASSTTGETAAVSALPDRTQMGSVELLTGDLDPMRAFYVEAVGLEVLEETEDRLSLGNSGVELLGITLDTGRSADDYAEAGLYHSAILYPDSPSLAQALANIASIAPASYSGSADHAVSLAFYFTDPDGNGLELYTDTPEDTWVWEDGLVSMGAAALDPNVFIQEHLGSAAAQAGATMGHVHLRVGDLAQAHAFYVDTLGFTVTAETEGALFYAAGGYHHHIATNTWSSEGATERPESRGLGSFAVHVGDAEALAEVAQRLLDVGAPFTQEDGVVTVDDPWGNTVRLLA